MAAEDGWARLSCSITTSSKREKEKESKAKHKHKRKSKRNALPLPLDGAVLTLALPLPLDGAVAWRVTDAFWSEASCCFWSCWSEVSLACVCVIDGAVASEVSCFKTK